MKYNQEEFEEGYNDQNILCATITTPYTVFIWENRLILFFKFIYWLSPDGINKVLYLIFPWLIS